MDYRKYIFKMKTKLFTFVILKNFVGVYSLELTNEPQDPLNIQHVFLFLAGSTIPIGSF